MVKKEIMKLFDAGIIYPISDTKCVSPFQFIPKKDRVIVVENIEVELLLTRVKNGWRVYIDNKKLNAGTRKYHTLASTTGG